MKKPAWRENTGKGVPSDFGGSVALCYGDVLKNCEMFTCLDFRIVKDCINIAAYQTTRTKAAKYRRVLCGCSILMKLEGMECARCNGRGTHWEKLPCKQ